MPLTFQGPAGSPPAAIRGGWKGQNRQIIHRSGLNLVDHCGFSRHGQRSPGVRSVTVTSIRRQECANRADPLPQFGGDRQEPPSSC